METSNWALLTLNIEKISDYFADEHDIFKCISLKENYILIQTSLKFVLKDPINKRLVLVHIKAEH